MGPWLPKLSLMATFTKSKHALGGPIPCLCPSAAGSHCGFSEAQQQVCPWALATLVWLILWLRYWSVILSFVIFWSRKHQGPRNLHLKSSVSCCLHYSGPQKHFPGCLDLIADSLVVICFVVLFVCFSNSFVSLGLLCVQAFSSCCEWGPLFTAVASLVVENGL